MGSDGSAHGPDGRGLINGGMADALTLGGGKRGVIHPSSTANPKQSKGKEHTHHHLHDRGAGDASRSLDFVLAFVVVLLSLL